MSFVIEFLICMVAVGAVVFIAGVLGEILPKKIMKRLMRPFE